MQQETLRTWFTRTSQRHLVLGYGSLMSADSRQRFSSIDVPGLAVTVSGFYRAWVTRSESEQQTYVGAIAERDAELTAQMIPTHIDPALEDREKDYRFAPVSANALTLGLPPEQDQQVRTWLADKKLWICETLDVKPADNTYPVSQTYIDTCLSGCIEQGGDEEALRFITTTRGWRHPRNDDRSAPLYPRAARVDKTTRQRIDRLLQGAGGE